MTFAQQGKMLQCYHVAKFVTIRMDTLHFQANDHTEMAEYLGYVLITRSGQTGHSTQVSCGYGNSCNVYERGWVTGDGVVWAADGSGGLEGVADDGCTPAFCTTEQSTGAGVVDAILSVVLGDGVGTARSAVVVLDEKELSTAVVGEGDTGPTSLTVAASWPIVTAICVDPADNGAGLLCC